MGRRYGLWRRWFAWFPIHGLGGRIYWLTFIYRQKVHDYEWDGWNSYTFTHYRYRYRSRDEFVVERLTDA